MNYQRKKHKYEKKQYIARLNHKTLFYPDFLDILKYSIRLLIHYLHWHDVLVPYQLIA